MASERRFFILTLLTLVVVSLTGCFAFFNSPPVARFQADPVSGPAPLFVSFDASGSYDPNEDITEYRWNFDDGAVGYGVSVGHMYTSPGSYVVTLTVEDSFGETDSYLQSIEVTAPQTYDRYFTWRSDGGLWEWSMSISKSLYDYYLSKTDRYWCEGPSACDWYKYVTDPYDDDYVDYLASELERAMRDRYGSVSWLYYKVLQFALDFVTAAIPYTEDTNPEEWPRYPVETLVVEKGDCEDTSILYISLVRSLGHGAHLLILPGHVAASVEVDWSFIDTAAYPVGWYEYQERYYAFVETTGDPPDYFLVGEIPAGVEFGEFGTDWWIYDVSQHTMSQVTAKIHHPQTQLDSLNDWFEDLKPPS